MSNFPSAPKSRSSLRLRLALSFTLIAGAILLAFLPVVYSLIRQQMGRDMDRQLRIDWALIEAHLEDDGQGGIQWRKSSPATPESAGYAESWFDVWAGCHSLLKHWPYHGAEALKAPSPGAAPPARFESIPLSDGRPARTFQQPATINHRVVTLRVFRDESFHRATLRRILTSLALGMPVAVLLAGTAGYAMAGRTLRPVGEMAAAARRITSDSLGSRLPNPNPHDELGQLATVFNDTLQRIESSFDALKRFTSDASHELRTPLTALRSVGEVALREKRSADELRETIGSMLEEAQRLNDLTDTLLLLARAESGRMPLQLESLPLESLVREVCERLEVLASEKNQRIEITAGPGISVQADRVILRQAVTNLLHNAIRHSPPDTTVRLATDQRDGSALLEITDQGPGIPPEHRDKVFDRFHRIDKARSRADGGAGLGLAIAKLFVEQHGGRIELDCPPSGGSCFRIVLPCHREWVAEKPSNKPAP
jgi:heavy metal sensor kinase